tara:strand:+ start:4820 stop:5080 length:261 start_codon:yes stop_codon:yes gene_type:complete
MEQIAEEIVSICDKHGKPEMISELLTVLGLDEPCLLTNEEDEEGPEYQPSEIEKEVCADIDLEEDEEADPEDLIVGKTEDGFLYLK